MGSFFVDSERILPDVITRFDDAFFGVAAGAFSGDKKNNGGGGMGAKLTPSCVLVINGDKIRLVNIKNQDGLTKVLDLVPEIVEKISDKVSSRKNKDNYSQEEKAAAEEKLSDMINESMEDIEL